MASGDTLMVLTPQSYVPPATAYATLDVIAATTATPDINTTVLDFDTGSDEFADWMCVMPQHYADTTGITVHIWYTCTATSGTVQWGAQLRREEDSSAHITGDFASGTVDSADTVEGTARNMNMANFAITKGANMDSVVAGDSFTFRLYRDVSGDNMASDAELHRIEIRET